MSFQPANQLFYRLVEGALQSEPLPAKTLAHSVSRFLLMSPLNEWGVRSAKRRKIRER
jgi:hypothetical protein